MRATLATAALCATVSIAFARDVVPFVALARGGSPFVALARGDSPFVALARDLGRYANSPLKSWFDQLASGKGLCCSFADGAGVRDVDWEVSDGQYRVRLHGAWIDVPPSALMSEPNRFGPAVVWPYVDADGVTQIRCFLPGAGA